MSELIKWSGSKDSQSKQILEYFPKEIDNYYEPFLGGGSIFLALLESNIKINNYYLSDLNKELIGIYELIKNDPDKIINTYKEHYKEFNSSDIEHKKCYFNEVRRNFNLNRNSEDFYWITRNSINGLVRYNSKGDFNASCHFGRTGMNPLSIEKLVIKYNSLFSGKNIVFTNQSYEDINNCTIDDLLYCDPPYQNIIFGGMYFKGFENDSFLKWINNLKNTKWVLSYDGKINGEEVLHDEPNYVNKYSLISGNSSFRRVTGKSNSTIVSESLYLNF